MGIAGEKPETKGFLLSQRWNEMGGKVARKGQKLKPTCLNGTQAEPFKCRENREKLAGPRRKLGVE
jgi:hypothetical protein